MTVIPNLVNVFQLHMSLFHNSTKKSILAIVYNLEHLCKYNVTDINVLSNKC